MGRKKIIYLQLYIKDYTGDERLRWCSPSAWGVYSYLLCLLNISDTRGALHLSKLEKHPSWKNSLTNKCIAANTIRRKLTPWASILSKQMPWQKVQILEALCELAQFKVIILQNDALIQPRMYRDSGHHLDPKADALPKNTTNTKSVPDGSPVTPDPSVVVPRPPKTSTHQSSALPPSSLALNPSPSAKKKTPQPSDLRPQSSSLPFQPFWDLYDKKRDRPKSEELWAKLSTKEQQAIMDYLPSYIQATPNKRFRKDPTTFLRHRSWEDEIIQDKPDPKKQNPTILKATQVSDQEDW